MGTMSDTTIDSDAPLEVRLAGYEGVLLNPIQILVLQWFCRIIVIPTNQRGGTMRFREAMLEADRLIDRMHGTDQQRARARELHAVIMARFRGNTYSTWRPGVGALARVMLGGVMWPACFNRYVTEEMMDEWLP